MSATGTKKKGDRSQLIAALVAVGMLGCFLALVYVPHSRSRSRAEKELQEARKDALEKLSRTQQLPELTQKVTAMEKEYKIDLARIPTEPQVPEFLRAVADILDGERIAQRNVLPQDRRVRTGYVELPVDIVFDAPFASVYRVLNRLEELDRISRVESLKCASGPAESGLVHVTMQVVIFYSTTKEKDGGAQASAGRRGARS